MGTTLTGTTPQDTYDSLIKVTDNGPLSATAKYLSDGLGNDSALALSNARVGIGTASPSNLLHLNKSSEPELYIQDSVATFRLGINSDNQFFVYTAQAKDIYFSNNNAERLRISSAGNVGIGTSAPASILAVSAASPTITLTATTTTATTIGNKNNRLLLLADSTTGGNGGEVVFGTGDTSTSRWAAISGNITTNSGTGSAGSIIFATKAAAIDTSLTERVRILSDGGLTFNGDTAQANALDDYEEGTWTMGVTFGNASVGVTYSANTGTYTKIGRQVTVNGYLGISNKGSSTGSARITGLPFALANTSGNYSAAALRFENITFANQYCAVPTINTSIISLFETSLLGTVTNITDADFANNSEIIVSLTYFV